MMEIIAEILLWIIVVGIVLAGILVVLIGARARKSLRYLRWASKAAFLLLFIVPVAYVTGADWVPVYSLLFGGLTKSFLLVPITQSVCVVWTSYFGNTNLGAWILCPLGAVQILLTGQDGWFRLIPTIVAMLLFIIPIVLLGNVFCGWACPIGTIVDSFDKGIEKFFPKVEAKRRKRSLRSGQSKHEGHGKYGKHLVCPSCPLGKVMSNRNGVLSNGILASALVGSAVLRFNVFCAVCPMGILTRGVAHFRAMNYLTKIYFPIILELWAVPIAAVLVSLRERRFWCKKLCPLGALLNGASALNPFIKPRVKEEKCVMRGCPEDCDDGRVDLCGICRFLDDRKCEKVCPVDINLCNHDSLARCTKCLECYVVCDYDAVSVDFLGKPDVFQSIIRFYNRIRRRSS